jgi:hypothetical protein
VANSGRRDHTDHERCNGGSIAIAKGVARSIRDARNKGNAGGEGNASGEGHAGRKGFTSDEARTHTGKGEDALVSSSRLCRLM